MSIVVPTILTASRQDLEQKLERARGLVDTVQIDIVDGKFARPASWPYAEKGALAGLSGESGWLAELGRFRYEVDLMVERPEETAGAWVEAGATRIVAHIESAKSLTPLIDGLKKRYGYEPGFAPDLLSLGICLSLDTDISTLAPYDGSFDFVQFMSVATIGTQGRYPFDERVLGKIERFRRSYPDIPVQVDGGVSRTHAAQLLSLGVSRLVVGSALWKSEDLRAEVLEYDRLAEEYGRYL